MRILVVEDEQKIANALKKGLTQESYAVDVVYDGDEGLAAALNDEYDVMILDRMLPGSVEGLDICKQVRAAGIGTPIIILTAKDPVAERVSGLDTGADDYLIKPFAFDELLARIRALLRRPNHTSGTVLQIADLTLDPARFEVTRSGKPISLSSREFALLEYLMRNPDRTLTKDHIIAHVWDFDADVLPNTVEVYISYLRNKIDHNKKQPQLIQTVRGFGYKISVPS